MTIASIAFGRFNPPHNGHTLLFNKLRGTDSYCFTTRSFDKKNPLPVEVKLKFLRELEPEIKFLDVKDYISMLEFVNRTLGYNLAIIYCGADRLKIYQEKFEQYNGKLFDFKSVIFKSVGERTSAPFGNCSSTKLREYIANGDWDSYDKMTSLLNPEVKSKIYEYLRN